MCHMKLRLNFWPDIQIQYEFQNLYYQNIYNTGNTVAEVIRNCSSTQMVSYIQKRKETRMNDETV